MVLAGEVHHMMSTSLLSKDYTAANMHQMATEHKYQTDFASMHNASVLNRPSIDTVCYDKWHALCTHPMCHGLHGLNTVAE